MFRMSAAMSAAGISVYLVVINVLLFGDISGLIDCFWQIAR